MAKKNQNAENFDKREFVELVDEFRRVNMGKFMQLFGKHKNMPPTAFVGIILAGALDASLAVAFAEDMAMGAEIDWDEKEKMLVDFSTYAAKDVVAAARDSRVFGDIKEHFGNNNK